MCRAPRIDDDQRLQDDCHYHMSKASLPLVLRKGAASMIQFFNSFKTRWRKSTIKGSISSGALRTISHIPSSASMNAIRKLSKSIRSSCRKRASLKAITRKEFFARQSYIEKLAVTDIVTLFHYAADVNQLDFDKESFISKQSKLVRAIITAMDVAVKVSRGSISKGPNTIQERKEGDVDALYFIAATRVFAEWRAIRLIPPRGSKSYAASINLGSRDMLNNLSKMEDGVHSYLKHCESIYQHDKEGHVASPTIRQLLQFEIDTNVHRNLPHLTEKSSASGVLWTKRQIGYQLATFRNSLQVPETFLNGADAAKAAYREVYEEFHSWPLRQVFSHAFGGSPPLDDLWGVMTPPPEDREVISEAPDLLRSLSDASDDEGDNEFLAALEDFGKLVAGKWEEILGNFNCLDDNKKKDHPHNLIQPSDDYLDLDSIEEIMSESITRFGSNDKESGDRKAAIEESKAGAGIFVRDLLPLLNEVDSLLKQFNMNDPTKA